MATRISWVDETLYLHITGNLPVEVPTVLMDGTRFVYPLIADYDPNAGSISVSLGEKWS